MAAGWGWACKHFIVCVIVCAGHVCAGRRVPVRIDAIFTSGGSGDGWMGSSNEEGAVLVAGQDTKLELWGSGLSRRLEVGLTAAQGVQGRPCKARVTPSLLPANDTSTHHYAAYTIPAAYTSPIPVHQQHLWLCTQEQRPLTTSGRTRRHSAGWIHQGHPSRIILLPAAASQRTHTHRLSLRSIDPYSSSGGQPPATPPPQGEESSSDSPPTDSPVSGDQASTITTTLLGDDHNSSSSSSASGLSLNASRKQEQKHFPSDLEDVNSESKNEQESEVKRTNVEGDGGSGSGGDVLLDVMLGDAPGGGGDGRTTDGENKRKSDDSRTSDEGGGGGGDAAVNDEEKLMSDMSDDGKNLMKAQTWTSQGEGRSLSPSAPHARESGDSVVTPYEGSGVEGVRVTGLRVEKHSKGVEYEDLAGSVLVNTDATLRLFGQGLTTDTEILFTAYPADVGEVCSARLSKAFKIQEAGDGWATVTVLLPTMSSDQERWYLCVRTSSRDKAYHQGNESWLTLSSYNLLLPLWLQGCFIMVLLVLSGLFSGLNLGLMALDKTELKIVSNTGSPLERRYARAIEPVRSHGNFLLCTLLLGNVLVNSSLTILLDELSTGLIAVIGSTIGIVIFGEIIPQAICSRHGLAIGARTVWLVRVFMIITGPVAYPISKILDFVLGEEIGNTYDRERLKELIKVTHDHNDLKMEEQNIICGALELHKKTVGEVMTNLDDVYMLSVERSLDFDTINEIMQQGYSRVPVYEGERTNIIAVLFIKDLAYIDPDDNTPLRTLCQFYQNPCNFVFVDTTLDVMFKEFKEGNKGHMAFVQRVNNEGDCDPFYEVLGLVTLEDVIEELIQEEIVDETDVFTDNRTKRRREATGRPDFAEFSNPSNHSNHKRVQISPQMLVAALQYLRTSVEPFKEGQLSELIVKKLLNQDVIHSIKLRNKDNPKADLHSYIYTQGKPADFFVLILEGHVEVTIGKENLTFESGPFTYFGLAAISQIQILSIGESPSASTQLSKGSMLGSVQSLESAKFSFTPDYSVRAVTEIVYLRVRRSHYIAARRAFLLEQAQKEPHSEENFEKEIAKMLIEDDGPSSPAFENTPLTTPISKDNLVMANGSTVKGCDVDDIDMTLQNLLNASTSPVTAETSPSISPNSSAAAAAAAGKNSSLPGTPTSSTTRPKNAAMELNEVSASASSININPSSSLREVTKPLVSETNNLSTSSVEDNDNDDVVKGQPSSSSSHVRLSNMNRHVSLDYKPSNLDTDSVLTLKRDSSFS